MCVLGGGGGGGVRMRRTGTKLNVEMIRHGSCEDTRAECHTYGFKTEIGMTIIVG